MKHLLLLITASLVFSACDREKKKSTADRDDETMQNKAMDEVTELADKLPKPDGQAKKENKSLQFMGKFRTKGARPTIDGFTPVNVEPAAVEELNIVAKWRVESAFAERQLNPEEVVMIQFGGPKDDGLQVSVRARGRASAHKVVPANNGPELVTNFDHTLDRVLDELGLPRKAPDK